MSPSSSIKRSSPAELSCIQANYDRFDHILFFNYFANYNKRRVIRRFKMIVERWINNATLLNNFDKWNKSKESKLYWKQRAKTEGSDSTSSVLFCDSVTSTSTETSLSVTASLTEETKTFFTENIQLPEASNRYFVDSIYVSFMFHNYQKQVYDHAKRASSSFKAHYHEVLCLSSVLLLEHDSTISNLLYAFSCNNLQKIITYIKVHDITINSIGFPFERMVQVLTTVQQVLKKSLSRVTCLVR